MEACCVDSIHNDVIKKVKDVMPSDEELLKLSDLYKAMGDLTRIRIISASLLDMTHSAISHQLRVLRQAHLVSFRKEGKVVYYSLDDNHIKMLYEQGLVHVLHQH